MAICSYLVSWRPSKKLASALRPKKPKPTDALEVKLKSVPLVSKGKVVQSVAKSRILNELRKANDNPPTHCSYGLVGDDIFKLQGTIMGPSDTPFEGGVFFLSIEIPADYPFKPPKIKFQTKVYHPNVNKDGTIHVDILGNMWTPALGIEKMLLGICSLLPDPNAEDPHNPICQLYRNDRKSYNQMARKWTTKYAMC